MNELHRAYAVFGLEPGSSMESILDRCERLILDRHKNRASVPELKELAEEELKQINHARDVLARHFSIGGGHKATDCDCQPAPVTAAGGGESSSTTGSAGHDDSYHHSKAGDANYQEELVAKIRDAERKARDGQEAAGEQAQGVQEKKPAETSQQADMQLQRHVQDEKLRAYISVVLIVSFVGLEIFGLTVKGIKHQLQDASRNGQGAQSNSGNKLPDAGISIGAPYFPMPGGNTMDGQQQKERERRQHDEDVYFTKLEIDKQQRIIEHCRSELTNLEIQIADPNVSWDEKSKLQDMRTFRQKNLYAAQAAIKLAQDKFDSLTGRSPLQAAPPIIWPFPDGRPGIPPVPFPSSNTTLAAPPAAGNAAPTAGPVPTAPAIALPFPADRSGIPLVPIPSNNTNPAALPVDGNAAATDGAMTSLREGIRKYEQEKLIAPSATPAGDSSAAMPGTVGGEKSFFSTLRGNDAMSSPGSRYSFSDMLRKFDLNRQSRSSTPTGADFSR